VKAAEIRGGKATSLRVRPINASFQPLPQREQEIELVRSGGQTLLTSEGTVWSVEGPTPADSAELLDVVTSGLPMVATVAKAAPDSLVIETRRFPLEVRITESIEIGLDEKVLEDIYRVHKVGGTVADVAAWLEDRLLAPPAPQGPAGLRRFVVSGDPRDRLDAFRIYGHRVAADVKRVGDRLRLERVVKGGRPGNRRLTLLYAPVSIVDATITAELHGSVRTTLSEAVSGSGSYLRTWQKYHQMEQENVLRRARIFGHLEYRSCERRRDGGWRFHLVPVDDLTHRLSLLGEWTRFELEAGATPPSLEEDASPTEQRPRRNKHHVDLLSASIVNADERKYTLDLAPPDDDEDQPRPPSAGYLYLSLTGDRVRLRRRERAEEALRTGNCPMPQLGLLMEGHPAPAARRRKISIRGPKLRPVIREVFGESRPTERQREAIELALNTPDVCLIQGPPGTGKTKVITAIEHCLAVLADEGVEPSHRILVSAAQHDAVENVVERTEVFGLPAVKVGRRRRGSDTAVDPTERFIDERVETLRARVRTPPEAERLSRARGLAVSCCRMKSFPSEQAERIRDLVGLLRSSLPPTLRDRALGRADELTQPVGLGDPEDVELRIRAARSIRVDAGPFSDDGPLQARKALRRLDDILTDAERRFLERCVALEPDHVPAWLDEGRSQREALIDRLTQPAPSPEPRLDDDTQRLLLEIVDTVDRRLASTRAGDEAALAAYLDDLENDPDGVRHALAHYTVVLASTLQQAAGNEMRRVRGIDVGQTTFPTVIVDEAARANPLDLFIPLSMAARRVILVGDHRQLPHLLEPDVERQLAEGVDKGTVDEQTLRAVQASLFERLWVLLRKLEQQDGIRRTVTLNAQFRMHSELGAYVSREFYEVHEDGAIESPRPETEFVHDLPRYTCGERSCPAAWLDVPRDRGREVRGLSKSRPAEARAIAREVRRLIDHDPSLTFGVIAFYTAQVDEIGSAMMKEGLTEPASNARGWRIASRWAQTPSKAERLRVGTVDAFQGKEFDVVFLSVTRCNDLPGESDEQQRRKYGHLMLENRLCVAMSRQKRLLVATGDRAFVGAAEPLRALRAYSQLCGGEHGILR